MRAALPWWVFLPCIAALVPYALFVWFYATRSPWFTSLTGRSLMLSKVAIVLLLSHLLVVILLPYPERLYVWSALFVLLACAGVFQLVMLLRLQRRVSNGEHPRRRSSDSYKEKA